MWYLKISVQVYHISKVNRLNKILEKVEQVRKIADAKGVEVAHVVLLGI